MVAHHGDDWRARALLAESLALNQQLGTMAGMVGVLLELAGLVAGQGQPREVLERAARLYGAAAAVSAILGTDGLTERERAAYQRTAARLRTQLGEAPFAAAWAEGRAMTLEQAVAYALEDSS